MSVSDFRQNFELMEVCHLTDTLSNPGSSVRPWSCTMHHGTWVPSISAGGSVQGGKITYVTSWNMHFIRTKVLDTATERFSCVDDRWINSLITNDNSNPSLCQFTCLFVSHWSAVYGEWISSSNSRQVQLFRTRTISSNITALWTVALCLWSCGQWPLHLPQSLFVLLSWIVTTKAHNTL